MRKQAEVIADAILKASVIGEADRIALKRMHQGREIDLGGLNRIALVRVIDEALTAANPDHRVP